MAVTPVAVGFRAASGFSRLPACRLLSLRGLLHSFRALPRSGPVMLFLLVTAQLLSLAPPMATRMLIDDAVLDQNRMWLEKIIFGLALILLAAMLIESLRAYPAVNAIGLGASRPAHRRNGFVARINAGKAVAFDA